MGIACREGDLLAEPAGIPCHQANARGTMGAGLALAVRHAFPDAYRDYRERFEAGTLSLGDCVVTEVRPGLWVASVVGQDGYGTGRPRTDHAALERGMGHVARLSLVTGLPVLVPWGMGCGLAGGDWGGVQEVLGRTVPDAVAIRLPAGGRG